METPEQYTVKTPQNLQEAKEMFAIKEGFKDWQELVFNADNFCGYDGIRSRWFYHDKASEFFHESLIKENEELLEALMIVCDSFPETVLEDQVGEHFNVVKDAIKKYSKS